MATSFKQQSHVNITLQHSITHIHFLSGGLPFLRGLLQNWTFGGKVYSIKSNFIDKTVAFHPDEREVRHSVTGQIYDKQGYLTVSWQCDLIDTCTLCYKSAITWDNNPLFLKFSVSFFRSRFGKEV